MKEDNPGSKISDFLINNLQVLLHGFFNKTINYLLIRLFVGNLLY